MFAKMAAWGAEPAAGRPRSGKAAIARPERTICRVQICRACESHVLVDKPAGCCGDDQAEACKLIVGEDGRPCRKLWWHAIHNGDCPSEKWPAVEACSVAVKTGLEPAPKKN